MAFSFDSTVKGESANSYATATALADYMGGRLDVAEYSAATTLTIQKALVMATNRLESESWLGCPTTDTQRLKWPRSGVPDQRYNGQQNVGGYGAAVYDHDTIPLPIELATFELALWYLKDNTRDTDTGLEGFTQVGVGPLAVTPRHAHKAGALPAHVVRYLRGLRASTEGMVPVVRG